MSATNSNTVFSKIKPIIRKVQLTKVLEVLTLLKSIKINSLTESRSGDGISSNEAIKSDQKRQNLAKMVQNQSEKNMEDKDSQKSLFGANSVNHSYNSFTDYQRG